MCNIRFKTHIITRKSSPRFHFVNTVSRIFSEFCKSEHFDN